MLRCAAVGLLAAVGCSFVTADRCVDVTSRRLGVRLVKVIIQSLNRRTRFEPLLALNTSFKITSMGALNCVDAALPLKFTSACFCSVNITLLINI